MRAIFKVFTFGIFFVLFELTSSFADRPAPNQVTVRCSANGIYCARSIPEDVFSEKGKTTVFKLDGKEEKNLYQLDWFAPGIHISDDGRFVIRLGPWPGGHKANQDHLAIAFYKEGVLLQKYSTLDIVQTEDNVQRSVSHYQFLQKINGITADGKYFEVVAMDGEIIKFDIHTGEISSRNTMGVRKIEQIR